MKNILSDTVYPFLSYDIASESVIKPCIKNDNQLVDLICKLRCNVEFIKLVGENW